jgi:hypothetical protein
MIWHWISWIWPLTVRTLCTSRHSPPGGTSCHWPKDLTALGCPVIGSYGGFPKSWRYPQSSISDWDFPWFSMIFHYKPLCTMNFGVPPVMETSMLDLKCCCCRQNEVHASFPRSQPLTAVRAARQKLGRSHSLVGGLASNPSNRSTKSSERSGLNADQECLIE